MSELSPEFIFKGYGRYVPDTLTSWIPWPIFDRIRIGYTVPILGTHPFRTSYNVTWDMKPESQGPHSKKYRLKRAICEGDIKEVSLASKGLEIDNTVDLDNKLTPLMLASKFNQLYIMKYLILKGAAIDKKDQEGNTALMHAVNNMNFEALKLLIENGADIYTEDVHGISPYKKTEFKNFHFMQLFMKETQGKYKKPNFPRFQLRMNFSKVLDIAIESVSELQGLKYEDPVPYPFNNLKETYILSLINKTQTI